MNSLNDKDIPQQAIDLIEQEEGLKLKAYRDPFKPSIWTIGFGHTKGVYEGMVISEQEATALLLDQIKDIKETIEKYVFVSLTDNELSALIDFVYNVGIGNFLRSTLLKKLNNGLYDEVPQELMRWVYAGSEKVGRLYLRRKRECDLWNSR